MFADARVEAQTDSLTGLGNRRKLMGDLRRSSSCERRVAARARDVRPRRVQALQRHLRPPRRRRAADAARREPRAARSGRTATRYRLGGDEFCVLVVTGASSAKTIIALSAAALSEHGEGFTVRSSHGAVILPHEARDATRALRIADQRMYAQKEDRRSSHAARRGHPAAGPERARARARRPPEGRGEAGDGRRRAARPGRRGAGRARTRGGTARRWQDGDPGRDPAKGGALTEDEWGFVRQHTIIGERILSAAPALLPVAKLVRASHERFDGSGYPDGLAGEGSRRREHHRGCVEQDEAAGLTPVPEGAGNCCGVAGCVVLEELGDGALGVHLEVGLVGDAAGPTGRGPLALRGR